MNPLSLFRKPVEPTYNEVLRHQLDEARLKKLQADAEVETARARQDALAARVRRLEGLLQPA